MNTITNGKALPKSQDFGRALRYLLIKRHCERSAAIDNTCVTVERKRNVSRKGGLQISYIFIYIMLYTPRPILPVKKRKNKKLKILSKIVEKCLTLKYGYVKMSRLSMR